MGTAIMDGSMGALFAGVAPLCGGVIGVWFLWQGMLKAGLGLEDLIKKRLSVFVAMIGVCVVYGLLGYVIINKALSSSPDPPEGPENTSIAAGYILGVTVFSVAAALGNFGGVAAQSIVLQPRLYVVAVLIAIFIEAVALYSLIVALVLMKDAETSFLDMGPDNVFPFASSSICASIGALVGTLVSGVAIMEAGVERPDLSMRLVISVVIAGQLGIFGLICSIISLKNWPDTGSDYMGGSFMLFSGVLIAYVARTDIPEVLQEPSSFVKLLGKLIGCLSLSILGMVYFLANLPKTTEPPAIPQNELMALPGASLGNYKVMFASILMFFVVSLSCAFKLGARQRLVVRTMPMLG